MFDLYYFINIYINLKRNIFKNKFIKLPKDIDKFRKDIQEVIDFINQYHTDPVDFLKFMVRYYSPHRLFPTPRHLLAKKAIERYHYHQKLKNRYVYDDCTIDGDDVFVHETMETVSYRKDIMCPVAQDTRLRYVMFLIGGNNHKILNNKDKRDVIYALVKLRLIGNPVPEELYKLKERIDSLRKGE